MSDPFICAIGVTGILLAAPALDYQLSDSYFVVAHSHYTMAGGAVFGIFAAMYFWSRR
jgi:cytochrome c oxidase subunit 1